MDPAREPRDPVPEGQPGAARCRTDATREPARELRPSTPPGQPGAAGDRTDATRAPPQHRVVFEVLAEPPPKPMKRIEFAIDGRAAEEEEAQRMSMREWFAGASDDVLTYDQVMAKLPPPLPRDDAAAQAYAAADVDAGAPPRVWAGVGAEACSPCRAPHAEAVDLGSPAPVWKSKFYGASSRRPPRHRRDACSIAWWCRFLAARPSQGGRAIAEK